MTVRVKENKIQELERRLELWKNFVNLVGKKYPHYDLTSESYWLKTIEKIKNIVGKLESGEEDSRKRELIKNIFISGNSLIAAGKHVGVFKGFINGTSEEKLNEFVNIIISVKNSTKFNNEWINRTYELIYEFNKDGVEGFGKSALKNHLCNIFGELYGKLHIEKEPIMNTCSRKFLKEFYEFEERNYNEFKEAFEMLNQKYKKIVGKLSEFPNEFINLEIDIMFNFFDKVKVWLLAPGESARYLKEFYENKRIYIGWGKIGDLCNIQNLDADIIRNLIIEKYEYKRGPTSAHKMLLHFYNMNIGDIVVLRRKNSEVVGICNVIEKYEYLDDHTVPDDYNHSRKVKFIWYNQEGVKFNLLIKENQEDTLKKFDWNSFAKIFETILNKNNDNENSKCDNEGETIPKELKEKISKILDKKGQLILYGVPGTGKTYLANNYIKEKTNNDKNKYEFTTFHQSYSYEDFIEGFRPKNDDNGYISYKVEDGIFKKMCILAIWEVLKNKKYFINNNDIDFNEVIEKFKEKYPSGSTLYTLKQNKPFNIIKYTDNTITVKPGDKKYPITYSDLKKMLDCEMNGGTIKYGPYENTHATMLIDKNGKLFDRVIGGRSPYGCAIYHELKKLMKLNNDKYEKIKQKVIIDAIKNGGLTKEDFQNAPKYYLIIDEINRGNISNILGELITLLEKDKRLTEKNEIITTLPYSKEPFAVPPNLYIIGTMNTADRSIALLDIALRRRFGFMEIEPDYKALQDKNIEGINLAKLLEELNKKIVKSIDKDHRIGHSYFLKVENIEDLKFVWYYEVIPLLEEYFYGNTNELKKVIGDFVGDYGLIKELDENKFIEALNNIISNSQGEGND